VKVFGQEPVKVVGEILAVTLVIAKATGGVEPTVIAAELVTVPVELVALSV
jgi:hypothetical protein